MTPSRRFGWPPQRVRWPSLTIEDIASTVENGETLQVAIREPSQSLLKFARTSVTQVGLIHELAIGDQEWQVLKVWITSTWPLGPSKLVLQLTPIDHVS